MTLNARTLYEREREDVHIDTHTRTRRRRGEMLCALIEKNFCFGFSRERNDHSIRIRLRERKYCFEGDKMRRDEMRHKKGGENKNK